MGSPNIKAALVSFLSVLSALSPFTQQQAPKAQRERAGGTALSISQLACTKACGQLRFRLRSGYKVRCGPRNVRFIPPKALQHLKAPEQYLLKIVRKPKVS